MNRGLQNNSFDTGFTTTLLKLLKKVVVPAKIFYSKVKGPAPQCRFTAKCIA